ncbi:Arc family DNA binding domain-containing protein [Lancefieldella parvula]|uniref:Arc family DNA binding domain-containing protein n=1 Tax=Lancefieldella parvula TaxID=1382 RepID=UPI0028E8A9DD|nr:Arc family DNA binding domain-containing protein [Lancefieldella parvula]
MAPRKQYPLRVAPEVWEAVERWAQDDMRSTNAQVEWILRDALKRAKRSPKANNTCMNKIEKMEEGN